MAAHPQAALPRTLWASSLHAAWAASAAVTAAYGPREALPVAEHPTAAQDARGSQGSPDAHEVFERATAHGDDHTIKFAGTALDAGDAAALVAIDRAIELNTPAW